MIQNQKYVQQFDGIIRDLIRKVLNHDSISSRMCHHHPVDEILEGIANLKKNLCIIDEDRIWLILSENGAIKESQQTYTGHH